MKYLIVNADDLGYTPGVNAGIIKAHREGIVTSTTVMTNMPAAQEGLALLDRNPGLEAGVHLVLTAGRPLSDPSEVRSLVDREGRFRKDLFHLRHAARAEEVAREWSRQIDLFLNTGRRPTHLDSHHNVHQIPRLTVIALELARRFGIPAVRVIRPADLPWKPRPLQVNPARRIYQHYSRLSSQLAERAGIAFPDRTLGVVAASVVPTPSQVESWIRKVREGITELVCHPGLVDADLVASSSLLERREQELAALCHPAVRAAVAEVGVALCSYRVLARE